MNKIRVKEKFQRCNMVYSVSMHLTNRGWKNFEKNIALVSEHVQIFFLLFPRQNCRQIIYVALHNVRFVRDPELIKGLWEGYM